MRQCPQERSRKNASAQVASHGSPCESKHAVPNGSSAFMRVPGMVPAARLEVRPTLLRSPLARRPGAAVRTYLVPHEDVGATWEPGDKKRDHPFYRVVLDISSCGSVDFKKRPRSGCPTRIDGFIGRSAMRAARLAQPGGAFIRTSGIRARNTTCNTPARAAQYRVSLGH